MTGEIAAVLIAATVEQKGIPAIPRADAQRHASEPSCRHQPAEGFEKDRRVHIPFEQPNQLAQPLLPRHREHFIEIRVVRQHRRSVGAGEKAQPRARHHTAQCRRHGEREDLIPNAIGPDEQDIHDSLIASSMSMTGISSLIGYISLQARQTSPSPFSLSAMSPLHLGHARIASNSLSIGMFTSPLLIVKRYSLIVSQRDVNRYSLNVNLRT